VTRSLELNLASSVEKGFLCPVIANTAIENFATEIARKFPVERVILFGSRAHGSARGDSDVDLLVIMRHAGRAADQAVAIRQAVPGNFAMDLLVRTPKEIKKRIAAGDWFIREILESGRVLYDASHHARMA
jgi:predicted nucleotidyltransferase